MLLTGAEILVNSLIDNGVDTVFGYPGGAVLNIYDALFKKNDKIRHILTCHEQGAAHAADGYARSTGKVGVCIATSGPGATNLVTGIATAYMDSTPMVAITGNVTRPLLGKDSFQEVDITGITMPITKHNYIVKDIKDLQKIINEAKKIVREFKPDIVIGMGGYICGAVVNAGVVSGGADMRLYQAVELCGGFIDEADGTRVNLAMQLKDGDKSLFKIKFDSVEHKFLVDNLENIVDKPIDS